VGVSAGGFAACTHTHLPRFIEKIPGKLGITA